MVLSCIGIICLRMAAAAAVFDEAAFQKWKQVTACLVASALCCLSGDSAVLMGVSAVLVCSMRGGSAAADMLRPSGSFGSRSGSLAQEALNRCDLPALAPLSGTGLTCVIGCLIGKLQRCL